MGGRPQTHYESYPLNLVAHNLERSADRVTNIAERVIYLVTGAHEGLNGSNY